MAFFLVYTESQDVTLFNVAVVFFFFMFHVVHIRSFILRKKKSMTLMV